MRPRSLLTVHAQHLACVGKRLIGSTSRSQAATRGYADRLRAACDGAVKQMQLQSTSVPELLGSDHLLQYLKQRGIQASLVHQVDANPHVQIIKSMLLMTKPPDSSLSDSGSESTPAAAAILVVLLDHQKVDLARVARHLGVARRSVRLAHPDEATAVTGYQVGSIPPCGHRTPLVTLVDQSVLDLHHHHHHQDRDHDQSDGHDQHDQYVYTGGGAPGYQLQLSVDQIPQAITSAAASTGAFAQQSTQQQQQQQPEHMRTDVRMPATSVAVSTSGSNGHSTSGDAMQSGPQQTHHKINHHQDHDRDQDHRDQDQHEDRSLSSWIDLLPVPWSAGSDSVDLVGVIAQKRRMAKLLLFCSLIPESTPPLPPGGTASYVRRLWRHPQQNTRAEVQLILGKTIERNLGREAASALLDRLKVGSVVSVRGRVQQNPAANRQQQQNGSSSSSSVVLDVVVHELQVLHRNREVLARAVRAAQRQGHVGVNNALGLLELQTQQQQQQQQQKMNKSVTAAVNGDYLQSTNGSQQDGGTQKSTTSSSSSRSASTALQSDLSSSTTQQQQQQQQAVARVSPADSDQQQYWRLPLSVDKVHWVSNLGDIQHMQNTILGHGSSSSSSNNSNGHVHGIYGSIKHDHCSHDSSSDNGVTEAAVGCHRADDLDSAAAAAAPLVVGLDCEWKPYDKHSPSTPVALLQLATRQHVFLVDMLAICQQQQQQQEEEEEDTATPSSRQLQQGSEQAATATDNSSSSSNPSCGSAESALGLFLLQLFTDSSIIKLGFGLPGDLTRLQQSYPHLPCFEPTAAAAASSPTTLPVTLLNHIDLLQLSRTAVPSLNKLSSLSLSRLVAALLESPLDKTQQTSNWEQRPLSQQQREYAAADVHVLTVLFDEVMGRWRAAGGDEGLLLEQCAASSAAAVKEVVKS